MKIEKILLSTLVNDPNNVRKHDSKNIMAIKGSLAKFGQQKPIVVDHRNIVIAGNGTLQAALELGWTEIDIVRSNLKGFNATAFAIADNRTAELAEWDFAGLEMTLESLTLEGITNADLGFIDIDWNLSKDKENIDGIEENLDGILSVIKIRCPQEFKEKLKEILLNTILEAGFEGVKLEG